MLSSGLADDSGSIGRVAVDVAGTIAGDHISVSGSLTSNHGNSGTATDTLTVDEILHRTADDEFRLRSLIREVVLSPDFQ